MNYLFAEKPLCRLKTENVQIAERKENQNTIIMSYTTLNDGMHNTM